MTPEHVVFVSWQWPFIRSQGGGTHSLTPSQVGGLCSVNSRCDTTIHIQPCLQQPCLACDWRKTLALRMLPFVFLILHNTWSSFNLGCKPDGCHCL